MESLTNAITLRTPGFCFTVINVLQSQVQLMAAYWDPTYSSFSALLGPGAHSIDIENIAGFTSGRGYIRVVLLTRLVGVDIHPADCPNPFQAKSKGSVPVAIVGSADLDVATIDPTTITLTGPSGIVVPALLQYEIEDSTLVCPLFLYQLL